MPLTLVILAAGIGSRYGGLKQMEPVGPHGEYLIDYSLHDAARAGFNRAVFVIRRALEEDFRASIGARVAGRIEASYAYQELEDVPAGCRAPASREKPWGTGQAVLAAREHVSGPFAVINADDFYGARSYKLLARFLNGTAGDSSVYGMVGFELADMLSDHGPVARGLCRMDGQGRVTSIEEVTGIERAGAGICAPGRELSGGELVSANVWAFKPSLFEALERGFAEFLASRGTDAKAEYYLPDAVDRLVREGRVTVRMLGAGGPWLGVTNPADKAVVVDRLARLTAAGEYRRGLWRD